jgi:aryl-alcohol dehydrogenase-like predicted oxidoreductase
MAWRRPADRVGVTRKLGFFDVSPVGLGCMNLSHAYGRPPSAQEASSLLLRALDLGVTHFDTAALYGFGANEQLLGRVLAPHRSRFTLASKGGLYGVKTEHGFKRVIDTTPEGLRSNCEASLRNLQTDVIDLYYLHRWDRQVPIEDSIGALATLVQEGKIRQIGLSEVSAVTLARAHRVHPIAAVQSEYSVLTRNPEIAVLQGCKAIGAAFVAFSPAGRGMLAADAVDIAAFADNDIRRGMPRFKVENYGANRAALRPFIEFAASLGWTPSQLALVWLLLRDPDVLVIPGTTRESHLRENTQAASLGLDQAAHQRLQAIVDAIRLEGNRYSDATQAEVDTERMPSEATNSS